MKSSHWALVRPFNVYLLSLYCLKASGSLSAKLMGQDQRMVKVPSSCFEKAGCGPREVNGKEWGGGEVRRPGPQPQCAPETPALPPTQAGPRALARQTSSSESFKLPQCDCRVPTPTPSSAARSSSTCSRLFDYSRARRLGKSGSSCLGPPRLLRRALRSLVPPKRLQESILFGGGKAEAAGWSGSGAD